MADTFTLNYHLTKPEPQSAPTTWGISINSNMDTIDATMKANATTAAAGAVPLGSISLFAGVTPPAGWLLCQGQSLLRTGGYAALFAILGTTYGAADGSHFNLPNMMARFPIGAGGGYALATMGGEATHVLSAGEMPAHAHNVPDPGHTHTISQSAHNHVDAGHSHGLSDPGHAHQVNANPGFGIGGTGPSPLVPAGGGQATTVNTCGIGMSAAAANNQPANANVSNVAAVTGITNTANTGGGAAHNNLPPYIALNFIIRAQ